jgi:hypothetical protein
MGLLSAPQETQGSTTFKGGPCYPAVMSSRRLFTIGTVAALAAFVVIRTQKPIGPAPQIDTAIPIRERTIDGHRELSTDWQKLDGFPAAKGERIDWQALVNADPKKPAFIFSVRCGTPDRLVWEAEAQKPATLDVDGRRIELPCRRGELRRAGVVWTVVDCGGKLDDLTAAASANRVQFGFAGQKVDLGERGAAVLRELARRAEAK